MWGGTEEGKEKEEHQNTIALPAKGRRPTGEEVEIAEAFAVPDPVKTELPQIGSSLPMIDLSGLLSIVCQAAIIP
jgi:hypothetical protein